MKAAREKGHIIYREEKYGYQLTSNWKSEKPGENGVTPLKSFLLFVFKSIISRRNIFQKWKRNPQTLHN